MFSKIQNLARLIGSLKNTLPQGEKTFAADPFTCLRVQVLEYILENKNTGMNELAKFLSITPPSATSIINKLVQAGLIIRVEHKSDRRKVLVRVTPKGKKMLQKGKCLIEEHMGKIFSVLNNSELDQFTKLVKKLIEGNKIQH